jgi:hypothetical protein
MLKSNGLNSLSKDILEDKVCTMEGPNRETNPTMG